MRFIVDVTKERKLINGAIRKYGHAPEHNIKHFLSEARGAEVDPVVVDFGKDGMLWTHKYENEWYVFSEPLAPPEKKAALLVAFITTALRRRLIKKVAVELHQDTRRALLAALPAKYRACRINYTLTWPIFNMVRYDPALPGSRFKKLRNTRNQFYRNHTVEVVDTSRVSKKDLRRIVSAWKKRRGVNDRAYDGAYHDLIDNDFPSADSKRAIIVDGAPVAFNAGWAAPNSDKRYYAAIGLHDYSLEGLGEIANLEDLAWIKKQGYKSADFGGGEKGSTRFKKQFGPDWYYKSYLFSVVRR